MTDNLKEKILALCTLAGIVPCNDIGETICLLYSHINDLTASKLDTERLEWLSFAIAKGLTFKNYGDSWIIWDCRRGLEKISFAETLRESIDIARKKLKWEIEDVR